YASRAASGRRLTSELRAQPASGFLGSPPLARRRRRLAHALRAVLLDVLGAELVGPRPVVADDRHRLALGERRADVGADLRGIDRQHAPIVGAEVDRGALDALDDAVDPLPLVALALRVGLAADIAHRARRQAVGSRVVADGGDALSRLHRRALTRLRDVDGHVAVVVGAKRQLIGLDVLHDSRHLLELVVAIARRPGRAPGDVARIAWVDTLRCLVHPHLRRAVIDPDLLVDEPRHLTHVDLRVPAARAVIALVPMVRREREAAAHDAARRRRTVGGVQAVGSLVDPGLRRAVVDPDLLVDQ